jgi:hypothetical protein
MRANSKTGIVSVKLLSGRLILAGRSLFVVSFFSDVIAHLASFSSSLQN